MTGIDPRAPIELPKPDRRFKPGKIVKDKKGEWRGHPLSVTLHPMDVPVGAPVHMRLNPPLLAPYELVQYMESKGGLE